MSVNIHLSIDFNKINFNLDKPIEDLRQVQPYGDSFVTYISGSCKRIAAGIGIGFLEVGAAIVRIAEGCFKALVTFLFSAGGLLVGICTRDTELRLGALRLLLTSSVFVFEKIPAEISYIALQIFKTPVTCFIEPLIHAIPGVK